MSLSKAIKTKDKDLLKKVVDQAVSIYKAEQPDEVSVETAYGRMPVSMVVNIDKKAYWVLAIEAYTQLARQMQSMPANLDRRVETAKAIALNPILRSLTADVSNSNSDGLL